MLLVRSTILIAWLTAAASAQGFGPDLLELGQELPGVDIHSPLVVADVNSDGRPDLLLAPYAGVELAVWLQQADGGFVPGMGVGFTIPVAPLLFDLVDLDLDGVPDVGSLLFGMVRVRRGLGDGDFGPVQLSASSGHEQSLCAADFDGDGAPDLLVGSKLPATGGQLYRAIGLQDGSFEPLVLVAEPRVPQRILPDDLDLDGDLDVVCLESLGFAGTGVAVTARLNTGDATFSGPAQVLPGNFAGLVGPVDLDRDGHSDFLTWKTMEGTVDVMLGNGDGTVQQQPLLAPGGFVTGLACGDLDTDGFADVVAQREVPFVPGSTELSVQRLERMAPEGLPLALAEPEGSGSRIVDLDGDGLPEVLALLRPDSSDDGVLRIWRNGLGPVADLGLGAAGGPVLTATGLPAPGEAVAVAWQASGAVALVIGSGTDPQPVAGGFLLPEPGRVLIAPPQGVLAGVWPPGLPLGVHLYVQGLLPGGGLPVPGNTLLFVAQP